MTRKDLDRMPSAEEVVSPATMGRGESGFVRALLARPSALCCRHRQNLLQELACRSKEGYVPDQEVDDEGERDVRRVRIKVAHSHGAARCITEEVRRLMELAHELVVRKFQDCLKTRGEHMGFDK